MNADEMFKELGYVKKRRYAGDDYIDKDGLSIYFHNTGLIEISTIDGTGEYTISQLLLKELQAINKKVEELGWIER